MMRFLTLGTGQFPPDVVTVEAPQQPVLRIGFRSPPPHRGSSGSIVRPYQPSHNVPHQGTREMARRRKQIERGQLKADNGLA